MSDSNKPADVHYEGVIPHLVCDGCAEALEYYKKAFGAQEMCRMNDPRGEKIMHAAIMIGKNMIFLNDDFPEYCGKASSPKALNGTPVTLHRYVTDCDAALNQAVEAGGTITMPAADMFWGDRYGIVTDPFGHNWSFATRIKSLSPEEMQAAMADACAQPAGV
ncbi:VOC family protein [Singulisphaera sp. PoT]|uniref:VOC family protein n=1 Tax=Singulisphaera sp. PoT TaxID=3411797 RepID=UPI003BF523AA